ncbi:PAS domain S-box protein [Methylophaga sp. OBS3]|uniref:PAS domain S-box protein n=1 Tax=Methylophaga sp. OBS3 TaxID=2991934 RepID=UPI00224FC800|nr:PAS domain S-box protein [Methylophaga sp. OBS3]MCX4189082.1 PAS domain S-box protein [Methylophaga sp. OBS3]
MNPINADASVKTHLGITLAVIVIAAIGNLFDFPDIPVPAIGFELSVSLAAVLRYNYKIIPAIFLGVLISQTLLYSPPLIGLGMAISCIVASLLGRWSMVYFDHFDNNLENRDSVISLLIWGSGIAAMISTLGCLLWLDTFNPGQQVSFQAFIHTWMWTAMGVILIGPRLLLLGKHHFGKVHYDKRQVLWLIAIITSCLLVFTDIFSYDVLGHLFLPFVFYPLIVWGALYVGLSAVYTGVFLIFMATYGSYHSGIGFYSYISEGINLEIWSFIMSLLITGLAVGISQVQREKAEWKAASSQMDDLLSRTSMTLRTLLMLQCKTAVNDVKGCYSAIFLVEQPGKLKLESQYNLPEAFIKPFSTSDFYQLDSPIRECFIQEDVVSSVENPTRWLHMNSDVPHWGGVHCFPILDLFHKPLGVLCVFYSSTARFQLADLETLQRIAYQSSLLIVRKRAELAAEKKHREVENERAFLRAIIDANPDMMFIEDHERKLTHTNRSFEALTGLDQKQALGMPSEDVFSRSFSSLTSNMSWKILQGEAGLLREEVWIRKPDDSAMLFDLVKAPMRDIEGNIRGVISIGRDITEQREVEAELVTITEDQQRSIGQELHDGVGQKVVGISFLAKSLSQVLKPKLPDMADKAETLATQVNEVISEIRRLARGLLPIEIESNGLNAALESFSRNTSKTFNVDCQYKPDGEVLLQDRIVSLHLFRIVQEAVNNAIRHGKATQIDVMLKVRPNLLSLTIKDNGQGFDHEIYQQGNKLSGVGLQSMVYRAKLIKAKVSFSKPADQGFIVTVFRQS